MTKYEKFEIKAFKWCVNHYFPTSGSQIRKAKDFGFGLRYGATWLTWEVRVGERIDYIFLESLDVF